MPTATVERTENATGSAGNTPPPMRKGKPTQFAAAETGEQVGATAQGADQRTGKYLTFLLGREEFAIQVLKVREIMGIQRLKSKTDHWCVFKDLLLMCCSTLYQKLPDRALRRQF